jgi:hypothetical protein
MKLNMETRAADSYYILRKNPDESFVSGLNEQGIVYTKDMDKAWMMTNDQIEDISGLEPQNDWTAIYVKGK